MKTAVIYSCHLKGRISKHDNEMQMLICKEYAQQNGIEIVGFYKDCVATKREPLFMKQLLFNDCQQQRWDMVLFSSLTILGRNVHETMKFLNDLNKYVDYKVIDQENDEMLKQIGNLLKELYKERRL